MVMRLEIRYLILVSLWVELMLVPVRGARAEIDSRSGLIIDLPWIINNLEELVYVIWECRSVA